MNSPISPASLTISNCACNSRSNLGSGRAGAPVNSSTNDTFLDVADATAPSDFDELFLELASDEFLREELAKAEAKGKL